MKKQRFKKLRKKFEALDPIDRWLSTMTITKSQIKFGDPLHGDYDGSVINIKNIISKKEVR